MLDFPETITAYLNFAAAHILFLYPKELSYSSRNADIWKIRARELGEAVCLLKSFKNAHKLTSFVCGEGAVFRTINSVAAGYHPLTHVYPMIGIPAPGCGGICINTLSICIPNLKFCVFLTFVYVC